MATRKPPAQCVDALNWLQSNKHGLGMLTGTDARALKAIAHCWDLYAVADDPALVLAAIAMLLGTMQPKCWIFAKELIAHTLDWADRDRVWRLLVSNHPHVGEHCA
jgi:hypothetical protein